MIKNVILILIIIIGGCTNMSISKEVETKTNIIPLEDFFKSPEKADFNLSPEGNYISYMKPWEEGNRRMNIYVKKMDSNEEIRLTSEKDRSIY